MKKIYHIYAKNPSKIKKETLVIDIYVKLAPEELEILGRQNIQVNSQKFLEGSESTCVEAYCLSYTIENIIKPSKKEFEGDIFINHKDEAEKQILQKYIEQLLDATGKYLKNNILSKPK